MAVSARIGQLRRERGHSACLTLLECFLFTLHGRVSMSQHPGTLTWLHLSDAHIGDPRHALDAEHVLDTLVRDLASMQADRGLHPDLVFFTGDAAFGELRDSPLEQQYEEVARFFDGVRRAFEPEIPRERVFIVPGNHDVNRGVATDEQREWLERLSADPSAEDKVEALIRSAGVSWKRWMERLQPYAAFLSRAGFSHLLADPHRLTYAQQVEIAGVTVGVFGLNSAWSCSSDEAKGKLWLGAWQLTSLQSQLRRCSLKLALSHHPFNWLTEREDPSVARDVSQMFDFHLHGHEHQDWISEDGDHARIAAGACYDRATKYNGYNFVTIDIPTGITHVHLRAYDRQGRGWVPRCIAGRTSERGVWRLNRRKPLDKTLTAALPAAPRTAAPGTTAKKGLCAHDYFSPAREIEDAEKFVGRRKELARAIGALRSDGAAIAIFGHAGLGKTSLAFQVANVAAGATCDELAHLNVAHLVPEGGFAQPVAYYCCQTKDRSVAHVLTAVLRDAHPPFSTRALLLNRNIARELASDENRDLARQLEMIRLGAANAANGDAGTLPADVVSVFAGLASLISRAYGGQPLVVVLDEFNVVEDKAGMSGLLKELHFVKFVLVGTAVDIRLLVRDHASVNRQLDEGQIRVREMHPTELAEIIVREEARARGAFHFERKAVRRIVCAASGMPYFVHLLGRMALREALTTRESVRPDAQLIVELKHVEEALCSSTEHMADIEAHYQELVRASWQREFVLKFLAAQESTEVAIGGLAGLARDQGVASMRSQVNHFLRSGVLEQSHDNTVRFRDPRVRVFARLRAPLHAANRARLQFVQMQIELREPPERRTRDSEPVSAQFSAVQGSRQRST
jgi:hypothetical protein